MSKITNLLDDNDGVKMKPKKDAQPWRRTELTDDQRWAALAAACSEIVSAPAHEIAQWVAGGMGIELRELGKPPHTAAVWLLKWARQDPKNEENFWKIHFTKLMSPGVGNVARGQYGGVRAAEASDEDLAESLRLVREA